MLNKISNANVLMDSFYKSRKNSIWKNSVQQYEANFLKNIRKTQIELRERRKLKSFKKMLDDGKMTYREIEEQYKSWKGNIKRYDCHKALMNMDKLFVELFKNNSQNSH